MPRRDQHRSRVTVAAAVATVLIVAAAGCGEGTRSSSTSRASGASVAGRDGGFKTVIPRGFVNGLAALSGGPVALQYAAVGPKVSGFRANINVVREPSRGLSDAGAVARHELDALKSAAPQAHGFSAVHRLTLDGAPARGVDYLNRPAGGPELRQYQVFALRGGRIYTVTYTALQSRYRASLPAMRSVLAAWKWT